MRINSVTFPMKQNRIKKIIKKSYNMVCENCLYNKNCQFLLKHKNGDVEGCTTFEDKSEWIHLLVKVGEQVFVVYADEIQHTSV